jgi:hypothetical protein
MIRLPDHFSRPQKHPLYRVDAGDASPLSDEYSSSRAARSCFYFERLAERQRTVWTRAANSSGEKGLIT